MAVAGLPAGTGRLQVCRQPARLCRRQARPAQPPLVTGCAGFIASHLSEHLLRQGAEVIGIDAFTDYYPRPLKEANLAVLTAQPRFRFVASTIQDADLSALLDGVTHIYHLAAQAGVRKSWGKDFQHYTVNNIEAT